jgi:hypothetical protein
VVKTRWGTLKVKLLVVSVSATSLLGVGFGGSARGAEFVSLDDCRRSGGHESGKYCSGGRLNGRLIREFILAGEEQVKRLTDGQAETDVPVGNARLQKLMAQLSPEDQVLLLEYLDTHPKVAQYYGF